MQWLARGSTTCSEYEQYQSLIEGPIQELGRLAGGCVLTSFSLSYQNMQNHTGLKVGTGKVL